MSRQSTHLHVLGNVPAELVDGETALGGLLAADEIDVGFLHELDGFSLYEIVRFVERELGGDTGGALAARLIVAVVGQRATHELHQALVGGDEARHLLPLVRSLSDLARHALVVRVVLLVERIANPPLALVQRRLQHLPSCHPHTHTHRINSSADAFITSANRAYLWEALATGQWAPFGRQEKIFAT